MNQKMLLLVVVAGLAAGIGCGEDKEPGAGADEKKADRKPTNDKAADKPTAISHKPFEIDQVDASRYVIDDEAIAQLLLDGLAGQIHVSKVNRGYRLDGYADDTLIAKLGLAKGDVIVTINDAVLTGHRAARVAFAQARQDGTLRLAIDRGGNSLQRRYYLRRLLPNQSSRYSYRSRYRRRRSYAKSDYAFEKVLLAMRKGIKKLSDNHVQIDREIMSALEKHDQLLKDGLGYVGLHKGYAIEDDYSVFKELKLTKYDVLTKINGVEVNTRSAVRRALAGQASAREFTITVKRLGEDLTIRYQLVDNVVDKQALTEAVDTWRAGQRSSYDPLSRYSRTRLTSLTSGKADALIATIKKLNDTTFEVSRDKLKEFWTTMYGARGARIVPSLRNGRTDGFKLYAIRPSSAWAAMGFTNGDTIHTMNALILDSAMKMMEISKLFTPDLPSLVIVITRRGKPVTLTYQLK